LSVSATFCFFPSLRGGNTKERWSPFRKAKGTGDFEKYYLGFAISFAKHFELQRSIKDDALRITH
jgi:hypothetical protein